MRFDIVSEDLPIGKKIESIRILRNLTQEEIAQKIGISKQAYSRIEQSYSIRERRLEQISRALQVTVKGVKYYNEKNLYPSKTRKNKYESETKVNQPLIRIFHLHEKIRLLQAKQLQVEQEKVEILKSIIHAGKMTRTPSQI